MAGKEEDKQEVLEEQPSEEQGVDGDELFEGLESTRD